MWSIREDTKRQPHRLTQAAISLKQLLYQADQDVPAKTHPGKGGDKMSTKAELWVLGCSQPWTRKREPGVSKAIALWHLALAFRRGMSGPGHSLT